MPKKVWTETADTLAFNNNSGYLIDMSYLVPQHIWEQIPRNPGLFIYTVDDTSYRILVTPRFRKNETKYRVNINWTNTTYKFGPADLMAFLSLDDAYNINPSLVSSDGIIIPHLSGLVSVNGGSYNIETKKTVRAFYGIL